MSQRKNRPPRSLYCCSQCGYQSHKWLGRCPDCQAWNTLLEEQIPSGSSAAHRPVTGPAAAALRLTEIASTHQLRQRSGIDELDRVLVGGIVPGAFTLLGGDPGIGKSTLILQAVGRLARQAPALYVTAEESCLQVKLRAERLQVDADQLYLLAETALDRKSVV